jgi:histidinol-phosphate aminotransferase
MRAAAEQVAAAQPQQQQPSPTQFLRPHLLKLAPYTPIEPFEILSARYGRSPQDIVKLDANENPYGPPPEVLEALANMPFPHIYPDPETRRLRAALAEWNDIPKEHLLVRLRACGWDAPSTLACDHRRKQQQHSIQQQWHPACTCVQV